VKLSRHLSLGKFLAQDDDVATNEKMKRDQSRTYTLKSIVHHIGNTANSGHYTADALRRDPVNGTPQWISYDDGLAKELAEDDVLGDIRSQRTAYMLLYSLV
jgi:uncharacterized UBP type Zn finger protein